MRNKSFYLSRITRFTKKSYLLLFFDYKDELHFQLLTSKLLFIRYDLRKVESRGTIDSVSRARPFHEPRSVLENCFLPCFFFSSPPLPALTARLVRNDRGVTRSGMKRTGRSFLIRRSAK